MCTKKNKCVEDEVKWEDSFNERGENSKNILFGCYRKLYPKKAVSYIKVQKKKHLIMYILHVLDICEFQLFIVMFIFTLQLEAGNCKSKLKSE